MNRTHPPLSRRLALLLALAAVGCPKPVPKMKTPVEVDAPRMDPDALAGTTAAKEGKSGTVALSYCVDERGHTDDVKVSAPFDDEIDAIAVETVRGWTFEPATRDGEPYYFCTDITFDLRFPGTSS
jgi:TonB family protein